MKILFLEDDQAQAELIKQWLLESGHEVAHASNCATFKNNLPVFMPDLCILDWELPDGKGIEILPQIIEQHGDAMPVLFTTQRDSEEDIVRALQNGADDYLIKPIRQKELDARILALSRRAGIDIEKQIIEEGPYTIDIEDKTITFKDEAVKLTQKDYGVALCFFQNLGKALSRDYLLKAAWGIEAGLDTRTVDMHVSRVRRALKISPENGFLIKTIYQHGYRLERVQQSE